MDDLSGKTIRGYELRRLIGAGGFGAVYQAYQPVVQREVAIKIILPARANQPDFIRRFETEAQLVARLEHLHIVPLYDYWRDPDGAYLVMRWLRGGSLADRLRQSIWPMSAILKLLDQVASALALAHRRGVIHRDIKPANILLDEDDNAYLTDFGIAKDIHRSVEDRTEDGFFGSPAYVSPEQILREAATPQSDTYSLGILIYELLTGRLPFDAPSDTTILRQHVSTTLPSLRDLRPDLPAGVDMILRRATAKFPHARYADPLRLAHEFRRVVALMGAAEEQGTLSPDSPKSNTAFGTRPLHATVQLSEEITAERDDMDMLNLPDTRNLDLLNPDDVADYGTIQLDDAEPIFEPQNPYKGLRAFEEADASDFFGRDSLVRHLLSRLGDSDDADERFLAVVGPSGSGKSSVVKAGVIPALRRGALPGSDDWYYAQMSPGEQPLRELAQALSRVAVSPLEDVRQQPLHRLLGEILPDDTSQMLLFIDQFEEVFTLVEDEDERLLFLDTLAEAIKSDDSRLRLIVTLRADFYDRPLLYPVFGNLMRARTEVVLPMNTEELRETITSPAQRAGVMVEARLVDTIIADLIEQPGALPLLQYALTELFERRDGRHLMYETYDQIGGVSGALARRADDLYQHMNHDEQAATRQVFLRLVVPGEGSEDTRRRVLQSELAAVAHNNTIIERFGQYRLLTFDRDPVTRAPTVELAHEALIRRWQQLRQWIGDSREALQVQRRLAQEVGEWQAAGRAAGFLATGGRLAQFEMMAEESTLALTEPEHAFLDSSIAQRQRGQTRRRLVIIALVAFSLVALSLAVFAFTQQQRANAEAAIARSRELAVTGLTQIEDQLDQALLLSLEALNAAETFEARNTLLTALQAQPHLLSFLSGHADEVRALALDRENHLLASGGRDNTIRLWDLDTRKLIGDPLEGHDDWVSGLAFDPQGQVLVSSSADGTLRRWDVETLAPIGPPLTGHDGAVWAVALSPNGQVITSGGEDGTVRLWDISSGEALGDPLQGHTDIVFSVSFDPAGEKLVSSSADGTVRLWDVATSEPIGDPLEGHDDWVFRAVFSPDGGLIASGGADNTIRLWIASVGDPLGDPILGHTGWVRDLAFSADGTTLLSAGADHTVRLWNPLSGQQTAIYDGHQDEVWAADFGPDESTFISGGEDALVLLWDSTGKAGLGQDFARQNEAVLDLAMTADGAMIASASGNPGGAGDDNTIRLWDAETGDEIAVLEGHERSVTGVAFSRDDRLLASSSVDRTVRLWDVQTRQPVGEPLTGHMDAVLEVTLRPDGQRVASGDFAGVIRQWDAKTGLPIGDPLAGHTAEVTSVAFSPDGRTLASGSADRTVRLWNPETGDLLGDPLVGHLDEITSVVFSPDGRVLASTSRDRTVILWDVATGQPLGQPLTGHANWVSDVAFHPVASLLATASRDGTVMLWDLRTRRPLGQPFAEHTDWVTSLVFAPDGNSLYSGGHDAVLIRHVTDFEAWRAQACQVANRALTAVEWERFLPGMSFHNTCAA